jgi:hypothetical protein
MKVQSFIQPEASIARVTTLRPGDVYKRLEVGSYAGAADEIRFGVVTDVVANGETSAIVALEYRNEYGSIKVEHKTFSGTRDVAIFPANPTEFAEHIDQLLRFLESDIASKERELAKQKDLLQRVASIKPGELTAAITELFPQVEKVNDASPEWYAEQGAKTEEV